MVNLQFKLEQKTFLCIKIRTLALLGTRDPIEVFDKKI